MFPRLPAFHGSIPDGNRTNVPEKECFGSPEARSLDYLGACRGLHYVDRLYSGRRLEGCHRAILRVLAHVHVLHYAPQIRMAKDRGQGRYWHSGLGRPCRERVPKIVHHERNPGGLFELHAPAKALASFVLAVPVAAYANRQFIEHASMGSIQLCEVRSRQLAGE